MKISSYPAYADFLKMGRDRKGAIFLEVGCCCVLSMSLSLLLLSA